MWDSVSLHIPCSRLNVTYILCPFIFCHLYIKCVCVFSLQMEECSNSLGVPVSCTYPVKNYHEERATNPKMDILILDALQHIVNFANDYVEDHVLG